MFRSDERPLQWWLPLNKVSSALTRGGRKSGANEAAESVQNQDLKLAGMCEVN